VHRSTDSNFENVYVGWGHKYSADNYSPPATAPTQTEYPAGPEVTEATDPSPDDEKAASKDAAGDGADAELEGQDDELLDDTGVGDDDEGPDDDDDDDE